MSAYKIELTKDLKVLMQTYFSAFKTNKKVAWCTSVGPAELLRSFGFEVYFPENHGALLGATRTAMDYIPEAVKLGYAGDVCSYLTADIGSYMKQDTPLSKHYGMDGIPKPDLLVYNTNQCREVQDWFMWFANEYNCPVYGIKPPRHLDVVTLEDIEDVSAQFKGMIPICEQVTGNKFDIDKFRYTLKLSSEATALWKDCLNMGKHSPSPISFFDSTIHMGPIVVLRGTLEAKEYYQKLFKELQNNVKKGIGFLAHEKSRVYWEGMPIWGKLRYFSNLFADNNSGVVASTYCNSWIFDSFDPKDPFSSSALAYTEIFINRSEAAKFEILKKHIIDFNIDGIIFHDAKTCFNNSNARFGMPQRLKDETGIKTLVIEGDLCDLRFFSEGQTTTKIETFIEQMH